MHDLIPLGAALPGALTVAEIDATMAYAEAEKAPATREVYRRPPKAITLDIDDTADTVHGHQQSLFNAHYDERCFMPVHIYDADTGHCVLTILRPGKTPDGKEVRGHLRRLVRRIRRHWPRTRITIRGDSHYGRREAMDWCEKNDVEYVFGLSKNAILDAQVFIKADEVCVRRAIGNLDVVHDYTETLYAAKSWSHPRRVVARIEATRKGLHCLAVCRSANPLIGNSGRYLAVRNSASAKALSSLTRGRE